MAWMSAKRRIWPSAQGSIKSRRVLGGEASVHSGVNTAGVDMEGLEAVLLNRRGAAIRAAIRKGPILVVALRLGVDAWEPLYAIVGTRRIELPPEFCWSLEAIATLEVAALTRTS
jgi:hypothetical protein